MPHEEGKKDGLLVMRKALVEALPLAGTLGVPNKVHPATLLLEFGASPFLFGTVSN